MLDSEGGRWFVRFAKEVVDRLVVAAAPARPDLPESCGLVIDRLAESFDSEIDVRHCCGKFGSVRGLDGHAPNTGTRVPGTRQDGGMIAML